MQTLEDFDIEDKDLCSIISNLLDNAIEACESLQGKERGVIKIVLKSLSEIFLVKISNTYEPQMKVRKKMMAIIFMDMEKIY